jgi:copper oxidase (laccase) domain-containing protein
VHRVEAEPVPGALPVEADGAVTRLDGVPLVVLTADCAPIAIADDLAVGVVHAGWKGLETGVVAAAVAALREIGRGPVRAVVGPCIRAAHYEFGRADLDRLVARFGPDLEGRTAAGRPALDVAAGVRIAFAEVGVTDVVDPGTCTAADPARWFSHRRDGTTGRQAVVVVQEG